MRKFILALLTLALACCLCACGDFVSLMPGTELATASDETGTQSGEAAFEPQSLYAFLGWDDFAASYYDSTPVALSYAYNGEASGASSPVFDRASIIAACDALRNMTVTGVSDAGTADDDSVYTFTMADGTTCSVTFSGGCLAANGQLYTVDGADGLGGLSFPGYGGSFTLFSLYDSDEVTAFAQNFDSSTPVSVGRQENNGAILTSTDAGVVRAVFDALNGATVKSVEGSPDQNIDLNQTTNYIFTMADGTEYVFSFAQQCLAVTVSDVYGPVYYWLDGADALWNISVMPDDNTAAFAGGSIASLRTDLQELQDILSGARTDLTVMGVYVDYTIDGTAGYFTLDGDEALSFLGTALAVNSTGEQVASPEGESITISVTLSDESGPIFYFTGDAVQQVVGTWFACDSAGMTALRSAITELAATHATDTTDARNATPAPTADATETPTAG